MCHLPERSVCRLLDRSEGQSLNRAVCRLLRLSWGCLHRCSLCRLPCRSMCRLLGCVTYRLPRRFVGRLFSRAAVASLAALAGPPYAGVCSRLTFIGLPSGVFSHVWPYQQGDTGTACTSTALWDLSAHGNKALSPQTDVSVVCRYAY